MKWTAQQKMTVHCEGLIELNWTCALLTCVLVSCGLQIFNLCISLINLSLNDWRMDTWTKIRLMEWTFWRSLWRKLQGKKGKKEKHLKPSINSSDIFFPIPRKKTSIRSLSDIRRRVLQKIYCSNCKRNLLLQQKAEFLLSQFVRFITGYVFFLIVFFLVGAIPDNRLKLIFSVGISTTVEPLLSGPLLSGQTLFGGQGPKSGWHCNKILYSTATSISSRGQLLAVPRVVFFCFILPLNGQGRVVRKPVNVNVN